MSLKIYPNGLRLSIINRNQSKLVSVCLLITSGTQSEKNYEAGVSEFMSRMLLMGTTKHPGRQGLLSYAKSLGIVLSSDNTSEGVYVYAQTTKENVDSAIDLLSEIAFDSSFDIEGGDYVRNTMLADIYKLQENPSYILERYVNQALFYRTGLANPKFGTVTTISRMTSGNAKEFLNRVLTPKNTVISVVGDVDQEQVYESVMKMFYSRFIDGGNYKKLKFVAPIEDFVGGERTKNKKLNQSRIFISFPCLSYKNPFKYALDIIEPILLKNIKANLEEKHFFHSETITHDLYANNGKITIEGIVDYEKANEYIDSIVSTIKVLVQNNISAEDFENEKRAFIVKFLLENDSSTSLAEKAAREVAIQKQSYSLASELLKVELLTVGDANKLLDEIFEISKIYIVYLGSPIDINSEKYLETM